MSEWRIYARDAQLRRQGEVDDFVDLEAVRRWCDIGTWTLRVDRRSPLAGILRQSGAGIIITRDDQMWMSGPWTNVHHTVQASKETMILSGVDDNVWLKRRLASPSPTESFPPYTVQAFDVRTGVASTILRQYVNVNLGAGAVGVRRKAEVTLGTDPLVGTSITGRARWQVLLAFLQELALSAGIGFTFVQVGATLEFRTSAPTDKTGSVRFSRDLGNLAEFEYDETAPDANYFFVGGTGTGTARVFFEKSDAASVAEWGRFEGELVDRTDTSSTTEMAQSADKSIAEQAAKTILSATLLDTPQIAYGSDYDLGTKVTIELDNPGSTDVIQDIVRRVTLKADKDGFVITPAVGNEGSQDTGLKIYRTVRQLRKRIVDLERQ